MSAWAKQFHKLGKRAPKKHDKILSFAKYAASLPLAPAAWDSGVNIPSWGMMLNDSLGDCTCAAAGHLILLWTAALGLPKFPSDNYILTAYESVSGYDPKTGLNDNGAAITDVLDYWRTTGIGGDKIAASASIDPQNIEHIKLAAMMFGGLDSGVQLPVGAQGETNWQINGTGSDWNPGGWGGHSIPIISYDADTVDVVTWGQRIKVSWDFFSAYFDEAYAIISQDWIKNDGNSFSGFPLTTLQQDIAAL